MRCDSCGRPAPEGADFRRVRKGLGRRFVFYCPACFGRRGRRGYRLFLFALLAWTALGGAAAALPTAWPGGHDLLRADPGQVCRALALQVAGSVGWAMLNWSLFFALLALLIVPHELGHALAARLVGMRVFLVQIGRGRLLGTVRFLGAPWQLRACLDDGTTHVGYPDLRFFRLKFFLMVLGGPLLNGLLLAGALWGRPPAALWGEVRD
jgi:hypothetical protein